MTDMSEKCPKCGGEKLTIFDNTTDPNVKPLNNILRRTLIILLVIFWFTVVLLPFWTFNIHLRVMKLEQKTE